MSVEKRGPESLEPVTQVCPLCGARFEEAVPSCGSCPLHASCAGNCCPRCGYMLAGEPATTAWLGRLFGLLSGRGGGNK